MAELERWRSTALNAEALNRELGASLDVGQLSVNTLQQEKERMKESYRQNVIAVKFFRTKAVEQMRLSRSFSVPFESTKAKIPAVCPDTGVECDWSIVQKLPNHWLNVDGEERCR